MNLPFLLVKKALHLLSANKRNSFIEACKNPEKVQAELKDKIIRNSQIPFPDTFTDYKFYEGKKNLTSEKVSFYETTSGSTGVKKEIPYTQSLLKSFENMFILWANDLVFHSGISFKNGKFFMSVSPKIGDISNDDRKYLSPFINLLLSPFLVSNPNTHSSKTGEEFFYKISRDLLKKRDMEIISIWSPTYLLSLLEFMEAHRKELNLETTNWEEVWPQLKLISCWTHAQASRPAALLKIKFPNVTIQSKGLLLTEAPITIPWSEANGNLPLLTETYLEFLQDEKILGLHEIKEGETYIVLTSQFNGFLRYNTQDAVKVTGFYKKTPILEFLGRTGNYSDLAGEKLSENILRDLFPDSGEFIIVPDESGSLPFYQIFAEKVNEKWEEKLRTIHHYNLARELHQLREVKVTEIQQLRKHYLEFFQAEGMTLGDIKEKILLSNLTQAKRFLAWIEKESQSSH